mgnify:CR=1 FL=1
MTKLKTSYLGLELKNPLIMGACNLTLDLDTARRIEDAGASAIVYKSLFEEQINLESLQMEEDMAEYEERNAEMIRLFPSLKHAGPVEHLDGLARLKQAVCVPVIGSLNCTVHVTWEKYALEMEQTGVDAIELNFYSNPLSAAQDAAGVEQEQLAIVAELKEKLKIPVSAKISQFYTNPLAFVKALDKAGVSGVVLFNRLFHPDIDLESIDHYFPFNLSQPGDYRLPLRFAGLLYKDISADICSNSGIMSGSDMVRMLLAGAGCVQVVSTVYRNKVGHISVMLQEMEQWMEKNGFASLDDFRGMLSRSGSKDPYAYQRAQYVDLLMKPLALMKKYPQV